MTPDPEKVRFWGARAAAYDRLCRRWEIFSQLSNRLIDMLPADMHGPVLDIGAGSGLTSELLLARHPRCQVMLIEPSEAMLNLARVNLAGCPAQFFAMGLDRAPVRGVDAVAAVASASMHYLDLEPAFGTLAQALAPGGYVAFNLWWHHWEETADRKSMTGWQSMAEAVCVDAQLPLPPLKGPTPKAKTRTELMEASRGHGFRLLREHRDEYLTPRALAWISRRWTPIGRRKDSDKRLGMPCSQRCTSWRMEASKPWSQRASCFRERAKPGDALRGDHNEDTRYHTLDLSASQSAKRCERRTG